MSQQYIILILLWVLYFTLHSVLVLPKVKAYFHGKISVKSYRQLYVLISILGLIPIILHSFSIESPKLFVSEGAVKFLAYSLTTFGVIAIHLAFKQYSAREFLGIQSETKSQTFKVEGILAHVRHPIYTGTILITLGYFFYSPRMTVLITNLVIFLYLVVGIRLEEKKLVKEFGDKYLKYKKEVPMLFPRIKLFGN